MICGSVDIEMGHVLAWYWVNDRVCVRCMGSGGNISKRPIHPGPYDCLYLVWDALISRSSYDETNLMLGRSLARGKRPRKE